MDVQQFIAEFGHIANAPEGVARLRELILHYATSGQLTERFGSKESNAQNLLKTLEQELYEYKAANKYRRTTAEPSEIISPKILAPLGWVNARLGQVGALIRGITYSKSVARSSPGQGLIGLLRANNIGAKITYDNLVYVPSGLVDHEQYIREGDVLIAMSSGSKDLVGKAAISYENTKFGFGAFCGVYRPMPSLRRDFIRVIMQSPHYRTYVSSQGKGIGINNLTKGHVENYEFLLPPFEEQTSIVAKVDELMALCDKLEAQQQARESRKAVLAQALLTRFAEEPSQANLHSLFHSSRAITPADLRNAIVTLAVQGMLVAQDCTEEPPEKTFLGIKADRPLGTMAWSRPVVNNTVAGRFSLTV